MLHGSARPTCPGKNLARDVDQRNQRDGHVEQALHQSCEAVEGLVRLGVDADALQGTQPRRVGQGARQRGVVRHVPLQNRSSSGEPLRQATRSGTAVTGSAKGFR
jgi:hypothetical protein